jgi:hypothetical protein
MKVPQQRPPMPNKEALKALASRAVYSGSVEHEEKKSWLGLPKPRHQNDDGSFGFKQNATICPLVADAEKDQATSWIKAAITNQQFNPLIWDGEFPREVWHKDSGGQYWFGRLTQRGAGGDTKAEYKGWPVSQEEWVEIFG